MEQTFSKTGNRIFWTLRLCLWAGFAAGAVFVAVKTIFPDGGGYFDFRSYGSGKNTIADPRLPDGTPIAKGALRKGATMLMNASASGDFSRASVRFHGQTEGADALGTLLLERGYRAYAYPEGEAVSCATRETLVSTDEGFFALRDGEWVPFVSDRAFRSRYRDDEATAIDPEAFARYPVSERRIGFLDATVVSYGDSAYVAEDEVLRPIDSVDTFLAKGYVWDDVVAMTGEEFGAYTRGKLYTKREPHPNGTVFAEEGTGSLFVIDNGTKRRISSACAYRYASVRPIPASLVFLGRCEMRREWTTFGCEIAWNDVSLGTGAEYQITYEASSNAALLDAEAVVYREKNARGWMTFVSEMRTKLKTRYSFL